MTGKLEFDTSVIHLPHLTILDISTQINKHPSMFDLQKIINRKKNLIVDELLLRSFISCKKYATIPKVTASQM